MPNYTHAMLSDAQNALAARLYDPLFHQWTQTELTGYIVEALQTWNALTSFWTDELPLTLASGVQWYPLSTLIPYNTSQLQLITQIENHLLEVPTTTYPLTWAGTSQFSMQDILEALTERESETLGETGCTLTRILVAASTASRRTLLPDTVIDVDRVAWVPSGGGYVNRPLRQSDLYANRAFSAGWCSAAPQPPSTFIINSTPPPSFDVDALPPVSGNYEIIVTQSDAPFSATANSNLQVPTDWCWVVKWGALFSLMSREMWAQDPLRMNYALARYREGLQFLNTFPSIFGVRNGNSPLALDALRDADDYNSFWESATPAPPTFAYTSGNLLAFSPAPDQAYTAYVALITNAPIPSVATDYIQVERDDYDTVLDYAQHLALFKSGGAEFSATIPLYQKFQEKAALYNGKLKEFGIFTLDQLDLSQREDQRRPRYAPGTEPKVPTS